MSSVLISLIVSVGAATFVWTKLARSTGNADPTGLMIGAGVAGALVFLVLFSILKWVINL